MRSTASTISVNKTRSRRIQRLSQLVDLVTQQRMDRLLCHKINVPVEHLSELILEIVETETKPSPRRKYGTHHCAPPYSWSRMLRPPTVPSRRSAPADASRT